MNFPISRQLIWSKQSQRLSRPPDSHPSWVWIRRLQTRCFCPSGSPACLRSCAALHSRGQPWKRWWRDAEVGATTEGGEARVERVRYQCCDRPDPGGATPGPSLFCWQTRCIIRGKVGPKLCKATPCALHTLSSGCSAKRHLKEEKKKSPFERAIDFSRRKVFVKIFWFVPRNPPITDWCNYCLLRKCLPVIWRWSLFMLRVWPVAAALLPPALSVERRATSRRSVEAKCRFTQPDANFHAKWHDECVKVTPRANAQRLSAVVVL